MRSMSIFCLVVLANCPFIVAQQLDDTRRTLTQPIPDEGRGGDRAGEFDDTLLPSLDAARGRPPVRKADAATEPKSDDWKPKYRVVLKLTKNGQSIVSTETYSVPRTAIVHREVTREGRNGPIRQTVAEENIVIEQVQRRVVSPGTAVLVCDSISVAMNSPEDGQGEGFVFETKGRTRLMLGSYTLDCDALAFADGVLSLKSTKSAQGVFKMQASDMEFELNVFGVDSSRFDQSVEGLVPEQDANPSLGTYEPERREFDREDRDDRDWAPNDRGSNFDRRGPDDDAADEFSRDRDELDSRELVPAPRQRSEARDEDLAR